MKHLTLIRHAKSTHDNPSQDDFDRVLNIRGQKDAPRIGNYLKREFRWQPDKIISSPAARAITTARFIAGEAGYELQRIELEEDIYEASVQRLLGVIKQVEDTIDHLCLVGHNPGLENLSNWLIGERAIEALLTCGVVQMALNIDSWNNVGANCARLVSYVVPRELPEA